MQKAQNPDRRTLLVGQLLADCSYSLEKYCLPKLNCNVTHHEFGVPAALTIKSCHYPLIILPVRVAPGLEMEKMTDFPEFRKIWDTGTDLEEKYVGIALQLAKYARQEGNPNRKSLIIFADTFMGAGDGLIPNVEKRILEAQADAYINMSLSESENPRDRLLSLISQRLGWRAPQ